MIFARVRDIATIFHGGTPRKQKPEYWVGEIPWVSPKDVKADSLYDTADHISRKGVENSATRLVPAGTIIAVVRSGVLAHSFPVALIGRPMAFNQDIKALVPNREAVLPEYLFYCLRACENDVVSRGVKKGATVHSLQSGYLEDLRVPLPPLSDQVTIVDILKRADGIRRLRKQAQDTARQLIPALFVDMFGDPSINPRAWPTKKLESVVSINSGGTPSKKIGEYWAGSIPWVSPKDMKVDRITDTIDHITDKAVSETTLRLIPRESVLIVVRGMILAHTVPTAINDVEVTINQDMKALVPNSGVTAVYLRWVFEIMHSHVLAKVSTSAHGTRKLDTYQILSMSVPIPPLDQQSKFAAREATIRGIQTQQAIAAAQALATLNSLLDQAFLRSIANNGDSS